MCACNFTSLVNKWLGGVHCEAAGVVVVVVVVGAGVHAAAAAAVLLLLLLLLLQRGLLLQRLVVLVVLYIVALFAIVISSNSVGGSNVEADASGILRFHNHWKENEASQKQCFCYLQESRTNTWHDE